MSESTVHSYIKVFKNKKKFKKNTLLEKTIYPSLHSESKITKPKILYLKITYYNNEIVIKYFKNHLENIRWILRQLTT